MQQEPAALSGGRYKLVEVLGEGGMAVVYRAWDSALEVYRAIKVLSREMTRDDHLRSRFETEARTMARLHHPNIVTVHDVGRELGPDGERYFMVMELLEGGSLMDLISGDHPPTAVQAVDLIERVLQGLAYAHHKGVIHRDIKPHNILLGVKGVPRLTDFGIARVDGKNSGMTRSGMVMGTWAFMAPELRMEARAASPASDIYAMGATLYMLITRSEPFDLYATNLHEKQFRYVPEPLVPVIKRAVAYEPEERFASAEELREALLVAREKIPDAGMTIIPEAPLPVKGLTPTPRTRRELGRGLNTSETFSFDTAAPALEDTAAEDGSLATFGPPTEARMAGAPATKPLAPEVQNTVAPHTAPPQPTPPQPTPQRAPLETAPPEAPRRAAGGLVAFALGLLVVVVGGWWALSGGETSSGASTDQEAHASRPDGEGDPEDAAADATSDKGGRGEGASDKPGAGEPGEQATLDEEEAGSGEGGGRDEGEADGGEEGGQGADAKSGDQQGGDQQGGDQQSGDQQSGDQQSGDQQSGSAQATPQAGAAQQVPTMAPEPAADGWLTINSLPYSDVTVDGAPRGRTPQRELALSPGAHSVSLRAGDGRTTTQTVTVVSEGKGFFCWDFDAGSQCR